MRLSLCVVSILAALSGCDAGGPGAVGAPCNTADDCEGDLICDEHDGQASCQAPHGHTETSGGESSSSTTTGDAAAEATDDPSAETTDDPSAGTTGEEASTGDVVETSSTGGAEETGGSDELCAAFCGCMASTCSGYDAYPYADEDACMSACGALEDAALQCFGGFCQQAMISEGTLAEHYCEHAWGELGDEKC